MAEIRQVELFLASSINEFRGERRELSAFVGDLGSDDPAVRHEALQRQCEAIMAEESRQWRELLTEAKKQG